MSERLRVAVILEHFQVRGGGAERNAEEVGRLLGQKGHKVTILAGSVTGEGRVEGVDVEACFASGKLKSGSRVRGFSKWAVSRLESGDFDVGLSLTTAVPATVVQPLAGVMAELHERMVAMRGSRWSRAWRRWLYRVNSKHRALRELETMTLHDPRVYRIAAISSYIAQQVRRHYPSAAGKIVMTPNAVEVALPTVEQKAQARTRWRSRLGTPVGRTVVVFVSMDPRRKGLGPLIEAVSGAVRSGCDVELWVAGRAGRSYHTLARRCGVGDRVRFLGKVSDVVGLYPAADVAALPTFFDPASRVVIEAVRMGLPVIVSQYDGSKDFAVDGQGEVAGVLIDDPHDTKALSGAVARLCDSTFRNQCVEVGKGLDLDLSMRRHVDEVQAVLLEAATGREAKGSTPRRGHNNLQSPVDESL
ncbi:MAG: glycosyltransferase [Phycisphaera sp.]|nr:glycosyltransferase [Phycisphaera sp.]